MMHEASLHEDNCFLTLTYSDENLPRNGSLDRSAMPRFFKRLRRRGVRCRYYQCGEYGEENGRPHYHAAVFGFGFPDRTVWTRSGGNPLFRSALLEEVWPLGHATIGALTFESAAYVARYVTKKVTGARAEEHYSRVDPETGEVYQLEPEHATMSRNPGIGAGWIDRYRSDVYPSDEVIVNGRQAKPPRYYDSRLERVDPEAFANVKSARRAGRSREDETPARLEAREKCTKARLSLKARTM